jgi:hypothetical protein
MRALAATVTGIRPASSRATTKSEVIQLQPMAKQHGAVAPYGSVVDQAPEQRLVPSSSRQPGARFTRDTGTTKAKIRECLATAIARGNNVKPTMKRPTMAILVPSKAATPCQRDRRSSPVHRRFSAGETTLFHRSIVRSIPRDVLT